jgi:hypothetical protein
MRYSSSEEGEVEEVPSDHYVFDDEKHRAKHGDFNHDSNGIFSSESEIYNESNNRSLSLKNEGKSIISFLILLMILLFLIRSFF